MPRSDVPAELGVSTEAIAEPIRIATIGDVGAQLVRSTHQRACREPSHWQSEQVIDSRLEPARRQISPSPTLPQNGDGLDINKIRRGPIGLV